MKKRKLITRIIAIVMCALLVLGIVTVAIYALAEGPVAAAAAPDTGSNDKVIIFAVAGALALVVAIICVAASSKSKNKPGKGDKKDGQSGGNA